MPHIKWLRWKKSTLQVSACQIKQHKTQSRGMIIDGEDLFLRQLHWLKALSLVDENHLVYVIIMHIFHWNFWIYVTLYNPIPKILIYLYVTRNIDCFRLQEVR